MKLPRALTLAASETDLPAGKLRTIARSLAARQAASGPRRCPAPSSERPARYQAAQAEDARLIGVSLQAARSLLTRTINLLK